MAKILQFLSTVLFVVAKRSVLYVFINLRCVLYVFINLLLCCA